MAIASILSRVTAPIPKGDVTDASRDDLAVNDVVELESVNAGTAYAWSIAFKPEGSTAVFSSSGTESAIIQNPGTFTVDVEGPYLIRLQFTDGTGTTEQYVRLRALTAFGGLKLVAAGERYDTLRIPVDAQPDGWADEQNFNLNQLLDLVYGVTPSTASRTLYVDPAGDDSTGLPYQTIQAAMDYANSQTPTAAAQWVVLVRPGTYVEDLTFYQWVHLFGWPGGEGTPLVTVQNDTVVSHDISLPDPNATLTFCNLKFERSGASTNATVSQAANGAVRLVRCRVEGWGSGGAYASSGDTTFIECRLAGEVGSAPPDYAVTLSGSTTFDRCTVTGQSGIFLAVSSALVLRDTQVNTVGTASIDAFSDFILRYCQVVGPIRGNPTGAGTAGDIQIDIKWSQVADISLDGTAVVGTASLSLGSTSHGTLTTAGGATQAATVPADSVFYDNTTSGITAENVQDAIDEVYAFAALVRTLDDAYDGGVAGTGTGRTIIADAGAVQIVDAAAPSDPIPPGNTNGNLEVVGSVSLGALTKPEITLDPNPFGNGPEVLLGREIWANDAPFGSTALILGDASGNPTYHNYNLRVGTKSADGGNQVGSLHLRAGDSLATINAGSVFIQGGTATDPGGGLGGHIYLVPGVTSAAGGERGVVLTNPITATSATLTAAGAFAGAAVAGKITLGTEMGAIEVTFAGGENLAGVHGLFNATGVVTAAGDPIVLTTVAKGQTAEVFFLGADAGVDAALGTFSGQTMAAGTWPESMTIAVTAADEITFGLGDPNPMLYNSTTGKLTVPGLIDPTGMVFDEAGIPPTGANKGAFFVSDTTGGGLTRNKPYYVDENGVATELGVGGGMTRFFIADTAGNTSTILDLDTINFVNTANETTVGVSGDNVTIGLPATGVAAGTYISPVIAVDVNGRITSALTAPGLQGAYDYGNTIVTAGPTDIAFTLSAAGGGFRVNGDGNVLIGAISPIGTFSMSSIANATMSSQDEIDIIVGANAAADKVLDLTATNVGAGEASIRLTADDEILLFPGSALGPGNFKKVTLPDSAGTFYGTPQFGIVYVPGFNSLLIGGSGNAAPGSPLSVAPGTTPNNIFMLTVGVDTNAAGAGSSTGAIEISSGEAVSTANDAGNSGNVSLKSGNSQGTTGGGNSGVVLVRSGESSYGNSGSINLVTGQVQATSTGETGSIELTTGTKNGAGSNSGLIRLTTGNSSTTSGNVEIITGTGSAARGHLEIDSGHTRIKEGAAPSGGTPTFGKVHVDNGAGSLVAGSLYYTDPSGTQTRLNAPSLDRHHINIPEAPNNTIEYKGWASYACVLKKVKVLCVTANTQGTLILTITNNATGNTVLSTANLNINSTAAATAGVLTDDTIYSATLTGTAADLAFAEDDRWTISVASNDPLMDADSIYVDLTFEVT